MTPGAMYDSVTAKIANIAVTKAHRGDRFTHHTGARDEMPLRDRVFAVEFMTGVDVHPTRRGCDEYITTLEIVTVYGHSRNIQQRIGNDSKLVADALMDLIGSGDQITDVDMLTSDFIVNTDRSILSTRQIQITFK
tara:strand:- start:2903 stop:3310 length:408 start_codon:yes stop_codon:yes gene_type:complete